MTAITRVEVHSSWFVKSLEANPVFRIDLLWLHEFDIALFIPEAEPFRFFWSDCLVLEPQEQAKVLDSSETLWVQGILSISFIVDITHEDVFLIEPLEVPPGTIVIGWSTPILDEDELSEVAKNVICKWTPPCLALLIDRDAHVWTAVRKECVNLETFALLHNWSSNKATLRNTDNTHLFSCEVWVVLDLVAHCVYLPLHPFKYWSCVTIADLDAFNHCTFVNSTRNVFHPWVDLWAVSIETMKDEHWCYCIYIIQFI